MKHEYSIELKTNKNIGDEHFVCRLLNQWCNDIDVRLRPDRFDMGEPIRRKFASEGVAAAVKLWMTHKMPVMLRRTIKPKFTVDMSWRENKGLDKRKFPWECFVWLDFSAGDVLALELFRFLIEHFEPAYGMTTTSQDLREKHFITFKDRVGRVEQYLGLKDVGNAFPGIYWATYFGAWSIDKIGEAKFQTLRTHKLESVGDGLLVLAYPSCLEATTPTARQAEKQIKQHLGRGFFFDKTSVDIESLRPSARDAEIIEAAVTKKKSEQASKTSG